MSFRLLLIFLSLSFIAVNALYCPPNTMQITNEKICASVVAQPEYYHDAIQKCAARGGMVAKVQNTFENAYFLALAQQKLNSSTPYIGVEKRANGAWTYTDGSPLIYQNWASGEPRMDTPAKLCAIIDPSSGQWKSAECYVARPFFCTFSGNDGSCPFDWLAYGQFCYYLQNFLFTNGRQWQLYNFYTAESKCQEMGAHLVSIHSDLENDLIYNLIASNAAYWIDAAPSNNPCAFQEAWIGLFGSGEVGNGTWTDGSPVDYTGFNSMVSPIQHWTVSNDLSCQWKERKWDFWPDSMQFARFICKKPFNS